MGKSDITVFASHKNDEKKFGGKRQNDEKKFGGKRQNLYFCSKFIES